MNVLGEAFEETVTVEKVLSQLERGCIYSGRLADGRSIRVKFTGKDTQPLPGDAFKVKGVKVQYRDKFGRIVVQIDCKQMQRLITPGTLLGPWLERLPNIGDTRAGRLISTFGADLPAVLADTSRVAEVARVMEPGKPSLAAKITTKLYAAVATQAGADKLRGVEVEFLGFLESLGLQNSRVASQLWRFMNGLDAIDRLKRNPYVPASLMNWKAADNLGQRILRHSGADSNLSQNPARLLGAINSVWRDVLSEGNTAATQEDVKALLKDRGVDPELALEIADKKGALRRLDGWLRAPGAAWLEDQVASALVAIEKRPPKLTVPQGQLLELLVFDAEMETGLTLTPEQHSAVAQLLNLPVATLQGGAGVGKTTVMKVLATCWERIGGDVVMTALAGKAALTLSKGASTSARPRLAYTIARLIGMMERQAIQETEPGYKRPASDIDVTPKTLLIVDEAGMLDTPSLHKLLSHLPEGARILFAGDEGQLPPVGIGKVFHDIVNEGSRVSRLTQVLRQAADSAIPMVAGSIRGGEVPSLCAWHGESKGVFIAPASQLENIQRKLRGQCELMVVAALKSTVAAINESEALEFRNSNTPVRRLGPLATVAVGDPVVATANRYQDALFNGLLGVVESIAGAEVTIHWDGEREPRNLPREAEPEIELAYGITCHRAQGSAARAVIIVVENSRLVTREWIYTAVTRSRDLVILVGSIDDLSKGIQRRTHRTTAFRLPARIGAAHCVFFGEVDH